MRIDRRRVLQLGAAAGAAALAGMFDARRAPAQTRPDPELVFAMSSDPGHLDPRVEAGTPGFALLSHIHDAAVWRDERTNPIPWLVTKWEQAAPNVLRWHLRKGVKFHNGEDFTAEAIKVTYERNAAPNSKASWPAAPKRTMYRNSAVDRYIAEERESFDETKVKAALFKAQELIWDDAPWIFLYENPEVNAINRKLQWAGGRRDEYPIFTRASIRA